MLFCELNSNFKNFSSSYVYKNTDDMKRIIEEFDSGIHIIRIASENEFNPTEIGSVCIIINISVKGSDISMMGWDIRFTNLYSRIRTSASGWGEWKTI